MDPELPGKLAGAIGKTSSVWRRMPASLKVLIYIAVISAAVILFTWVRRPKEEKSGPVVNNTVYASQDRSHPEENRDGDAITIVKTLPIPETREQSPKQDTAAEPQRPAGRRATLHADSKKTVPHQINVESGSVVSFGQQGGITAQNVTIGQRDRHLDDGVMKQLLDQIDHGEKVQVIGLLGDGEAVQFAEEINNFLKRQRYEVQMSQRAWFGPMTVGHFIRKTPEGFEIRIGKNPSP
jgi:hypothetical protein